MKRLLWLALLLPTMVFAQAELEPRINANENSVQAIAVRVGDLEESQVVQDGRLDALELSPVSGPQLVAVDSNGFFIGLAFPSSVNGNGRAFVFYDTSIEVVRFALTLGGIRMDNNKPIGVRYANTTCSGPAFFGREGPTRTTPNVFGSDTFTEIQASNGNIIRSIPESTGIMFAAHSSQSWIGTEAEPCNVINVAFTLFPTEVIGSIAGFSFPIRLELQ